MSGTATQLRRPVIVTDPVGAAGLGTVLGVWAHPDDEAYLSAGLMSLARAAGNRVVCVTATRGEHGTDDPDRLPPSYLEREPTGELRPIVTGQLSGMKRSGATYPLSAMARLRTLEMAGAMAALDVREHRFLGLEDGTLADVPAGPQIERIHRLLAWFRPDTIVTFGPDGITGHPDHRAVSAWTTAAWRFGGCRGRLLYATTTDMFADEHAGLHDRLPVFRSGLPSRTPTHQVALTVEVRGALLDTKQAALHAHASQTHTLRATLGEAVFREWWRDETFVEADAVT